MEYRDRAIQALNRLGIRPSEPRIIIYAYLDQHHTHPTADDIYRDLVKMHPTLSRTTIYNTLKLLQENKLVKVLSIDDNQVRYELNIGLHAHFKCSVCNCVTDVFSENYHKIPLPDSSFIVQQTDIFFQGICPQCNKQKER